MIRIELRLCVGEEVGRKGIQARWWWDSRQGGEPFELSMVSDTIREKGKKKNNGSTHAVPHNAMFRNLRRNSP